ncbi:MAG: AMP-binding protein [Caldilineaceae bacterium]
MDQRKDHCTIRHCVAETDPCQAALLSSIWSAATGRWRCGWRSEAGRVVADLSPTMIASAERQRRRNGVDNVQFVVGDVQQLALAPAAFDLVVSSFALHHTDVTSTLPQVAQSVRTGGWLFLQEPICPVDGALRSAWYRWLALREVPSLIRQVGVGQTLQIQRFQQSRAWIDHQVANKHWPAHRWQSVVRVNLPGANVTPKDDHVLVLWQRVPTESAPTYSRSTEQVDVAAPTPIVVKRTYLRPVPEGYTPFPREDVERSVVSRFEDQVERHAQQVALRTPAAAFTYAALNAAANRLGRQVTAHSSASETPVALLMDQDDPVIAALMGVLKAGHPYVVIDPADPVDRQQRIVDLTGAEVLVTTAARASSLSALRTSTGLIYEEVQDTLSPDNLGIALSADHLAAIFFTSGSTGAPKGVARDHRQFLHSTWLNTNSYYVSPSDRQSLLYFPGFTASVPNIYDTLLNGATLCSLNPRNLSASSLLNWLRHEQITHFNPPIGLWRGIVEAISAGQAWPDLRLVTLAGQSLYGKDIRQFQAAFGRSTILLYVLAMTEAGAVTQAYIDHTTVSTIDGVVPVGYPVADKEIVVRDATGEPAAPGEMGQIAINSAYLSLGYWQNEAETTNHFRPHPDTPRRRTFLSNDRGSLREDGCLEFYGRGDSIVKVRGYRVDLAAIEAQLNSHPQLIQAAVVARPRQDGERRLIAYVCSGKDNNLAPTDHELSAFLGESLPRYMIPERFMWLDAMPLTASGKVDRRTLPPPSRVRPDLATPFVGPSSELEQQIADLWAELLELDEVGVEDNFFAIGGDSILAMRIVLTVEQKTGCPVPPEYFRTATVAHLAHLLSQAEGSSSGSGEVVHSPQQAKTAPSHLRSAKGKLRDHIVKRGPIGHEHALPYGLGVRLQRAWLAIWESRPGKPGVIFVFMHSSLVHLFAACLQCDKRETILIYGHDTAERSVQIHKAMQMLRHGGAAITFGDGRFGRFGATLPFYNGQFTFRPGYAELAIQTQARVTAVFANLSTDGHVTFEMCPLSLDTSVPDSIQGDDLARTYGEMVLAKWPAIYTSHRLGHLRKMLKRAGQTQLPEAVI